MISPLQGQRRLRANFRGRLRPCLPDGGRGLRHLPAEVFEQQHAKSMSIDEVLKISDLVTIHMPLTPETKNLSNAKSIAGMKDDAVVLNMARGGIVN